MKEPFADLNTKNIDEHIEHILQSIPARRDDEESHCLRDLQYLYRKEEILARARQRLMITSLPDQTSERAHQQVSTSTVGRKRSTMFSQPQTQSVREPFSWPKIVTLLAAALLLIGAIIGTTSFLNMRIQHPPGSGQNGNKINATTTASTMPASTIVFSDPLSQNVHNWPVGHFGQQYTVFKDGAYHIANQGLATAVVSQQHFPQTVLSYQLTMEEIAGNDHSAMNLFGMLLRYNVQTVRGMRVETFYVFEILNDNGKSQYVFSKYDNSKSYPWIQVGKPMKAGKEFHSGQGPDAANTVKISANGNSFTFTVNGQLVGMATDENPLQSGMVGMVVGLKGTEVAFSNLLITQP